MQRSPLLIGVVFLVTTFAGASAARAEVRASAALAIAEKVCILPKRAEYIEWSVSPSDEALPPRPSSPIPFGRYWLVTVEYFLHGDTPGNGEAPAALSIAVPKNGDPAPAKCTLFQFPNFEIRNSLKN